MKKTLIFLLTLSLSLSGASRDRAEIIFNSIIIDLDYLSNATPPVKIRSNSSNDTFMKNVTCNTSKQFLEHLYGFLDKVDEDERSKINDTLYVIKENLKIAKDYILQNRKPTTVRCKKYGSRKELVSYVKILQCLNRGCNITKTN